MLLSHLRRPSGQGRGWRGVCAICARLSAQGRGWRGVCAICGAFAEGRGWRGVCLFRGALLPHKATGGRTAGLVRGGGRPAGPRTKTVRRVSCRVTPANMVQGRCHRDRISSWTYLWRKHRLGLALLWPQAWPAYRASPARRAEALKVPESGCRSAAVTGQGDGVVTGGTRRPGSWLTGGYSMISGVPCHRSLWPGDHAIGCRWPAPTHRRSIRPRRGRG